MLHAICSVCLLTTVLVCKVSGKWFLQALVTGVGECGAGDGGEGGNQVLHLLQGGDPLGDAAAADCLCD